MSKEGTGASRIYPSRAKTALVTRPRDDARGFASKLEAAGVKAILSPVLEIEFIPQRLDLEGVGALVFTSANGVRAFVASAPSAPRIGVYAVGQATAQAAQAAGFARIDEAAGDAESLIRILARAIDGGAIQGSLLHIGAEYLAADICAALAAKGIDCRALTLYAAHPIETLAQEADAAFASSFPPDWVTLFSPRSARLFLKQVERCGHISRLHHCRAACLSEAVARALAGTIWRSVEVAEAPSADSMTDLIASSLIQPES